MSFFPSLAIKDVELSLRRLSQILRALSVVDTADRQRVTVESFGGITGMTGTGSTQAGVTLRVVTATDSTIGTLTTITGGTITSVTQFASVDLREMFITNSRIQYNTGIRNQLLFS